VLSKEVDNDLTEKEIGMFYKTYNAWGYGHLEKVYLNALIYELNKLGLKVESQKPIEVHYENTIIGKYYADLRVEDKHIIELKTAARILPEHEAQLLHNKKSTETELGLILNYGPQAEIKRKILKVRNLRKSA